MLLPTELPSHQICNFLVIETISCLTTCLIYIDFWNLQYGKGNFLCLRLILFENSEYAGVFGMVKSSNVTKISSHMDWKSYNATYITDYKYGCLSEESDEGEWMCGFNVAQDTVVSVV